MLGITIVIALTLINGVFSMYEMAMVASRKIRLEQKSEDGDKGAQTAMELLQTPNRFLSTVQVGITLVGIVSGAFGGASLAEPLGAFFIRRGWFGQSAQSVAFILVVTAITYLSLVFGELLPKRIALNNPEVIASSLSGLMRGLSKVTRPIVNFLTFSTELSMKLLGIDSQPEPIVTEEEIKLLIEEGREGGVFEAVEQDMVSGVFRLGERRVDALMTPRTDILWIDLDDDKEAILQQLVASDYSRIPVAKGDLDQVEGIIDVKDLIGIDFHAESFHFEDYIRTPLYVPENWPALKVFDLFRTSGIHQALVIDEYGGVQGIVTLYDVLEAIVGEIPRDEEDKDQEAVLRTDGSWLFDGMIAIDELKEILEVDEFPGETREDFQTLSGFVMDQLGTIPKVGQSFDWDRFTFEVVDMDARRVDRVLVTIKPDPAG